MATFEYLTQNGTVIVDTSQIKSDVEAEFLALPGVTGLPDPSSFEGRLLDAEVTSRVSVARNNARLANQVNPNLSSGTFIDAHLALIGSERDGQTRSTVQCTLTGVVGTIIPAGSLAQDTTDGKNIWSLVSEVTIPAGGSVDASFESQDYGPISAGIGQITKIITGVVGWETVTNSAPAVPGKLQQSDALAKRKRRRELGRNSKSNAYSVLAAVSAVEGVEGVKFRENNTSSQQVIDGVTLDPHSTWIVADGGADLDIAEAYYIARTGGAAFNGSVSIVYEDPDSGQSITVKFDRPTYIPLICRVTIRQSMTLISIDDIKQAVVDYANGQLDGEPGFAVGEYASPFEVAAALNQELSEVFINKVELSTKADGAGSYSTDTIQNQVFEKSTITTGDVEVVTV